jgi:uncharacterized tellurite resistance protein B-like protein
MKRDNPLSEIQSALTDRQKGAIICCLVILSQSKGVPAEADIEYLSATAKQMDFDFDNPACRAMMEAREEIIVSELNAMTEGQKDWFAYALHGMASADGKIQECEMAVAIDICNRIGVSDERYIGIIKKVEILMHRLKLD